MTSMMMDSGVMGMQAMGTAMGTTMGMPAAGMGMMIPRCTIRMEKIQGGMRVRCTSMEEMAAKMMQHMMSMMGSGMMSCVMLMNGMTVMRCNMIMGMCKCDTTADGMVMTYTSGDAQNVAMIQECCACMTMMMENGCSCCVMMNNVPLCCG